MRIALHTPFVLQRNTGITRYIFGLLDTLAAADEGRSEFVCFWPPAAPWSSNLPSNFAPEYLTIGTGGGSGNPLARILRESAWIARLHRRRPFDVLHSPFGYLPLRTPVPAVLTLPDMRALRLPKTFTRARGAFLRWIIPRSLRRADLILAMSAATKDEILDLVSGVRQEQVRVSYPGVDARWRTRVSSARIAAVRERFGLGGAPFLLTASTREPHKNLPRLIEAFAQTVRGSAGSERLTLALAGATFGSGANDDISALAQRLGISEAVLPLGIVDDDDLTALYAAASVFCFPSLYEGFGLPPLEAMSVGTPVLAGNASCLPEVLGDAAELVDPYSVNAIAEGLQRLLTDEARRTQMTAAGFERSRRYDWARHGREVLTAYADVGPTG